MHLSRRLPGALAALLALCTTAAAQGDAPPPIPADKDPKTTASGLKYTVLTAGPAEGPRPKDRDQVKVHYTGWLENGTVFDSSRQRGEPATFRVGQVIAGWNEGLALMTVGTRLKLTIPSDLAYGDEGRPPVIPQKATLIFDVELLELTPAQPAPVFTAGTKEKQKTTPEGLVWEPLVEGTGEPLGPNDLATVTYAFFTTGGKLLDCTGDSGMRFQVNAKRANLLGQDGETQPVGLQFLPVAAQTLRKGQTVRLEVPPGLLFGAQARGPDLPANSTTVWVLAVTAVEQLPVAPTFALTPPDKQKKTASGLIYEVLEEGTGKTPAMGQAVTVHYTGWLTDGTQFDSSFDRGSPATFTLGQVIAGWNEGLQLMKEGGTMRLTIPANLAYGERGRPSIPPNSTLVFVVKLIRVGGH